MLGRVKFVTVEFKHVLITKESKKTSYARKIGLRKNTTDVMACLIAAIIKQENEERFEVETTAFAFTANTDTFNTKKGKCLSFQRAYKQCPRLIQRAIKEKYDVNKWK